SIPAPVPIAASPTAPASPRAAPPTSTDPCARDDEAHAPARPSISDVIDARVGELSARARALGPDASPALREGLAMLPTDPHAAIRRLEQAPDRADGGFDHAASAAIYAGVR